MVKHSLRPFDDRCTRTVRGMMKTFRSSALPFLRERVALLLPHGSQAEPGSRRTKNIGTITGGQKLRAQVFSDRSALRGDREVTSSQSVPARRDEILHIASAVCIRLDRGCIREEGFHQSCCVSAWWLKSKPASGVNRVSPIACFYRR